MSEQGKEDIGAIIRLADRLVELINSLRDYSRAGNTDEAVENVDLGSVLNEAIDNLQPTIRNAGMKIDVPRKLPVVRCARAHALALMQNLISNAVKHHGETAPYVRVEADVAGDGTVNIVVTDNGPGIPREMEDDVFKMFRRLADTKETGGDAGTGGGQGSTGMGLAIVKRIVERYNGTVSLRPSGDGGTAFELSLRTV